MHGSVYSAVTRVSVSVCVLFVLCVLMPSQTNFINELKTLLMKFPTLVLIKLVNENKHHSLCVGKNSFFCGRLFRLVPLLTPCKRFNMQFSVPL